MFVTTYFWAVNWDVSIRNASIVLSLISARFIIMRLEQVVTHWNAIYNPVEFVNEAS
jgi:hypothetical protein